MKDELVSIVIPTFNRAELLKIAIKSVLRQSYGSVEVIVVDDGSTDDTEEMLKGTFSPGLRHFKTNNQGAPAARNIGLQNANGTYIKFLDSDDVLAPEAIEKQMLRYRSLNGGANTVVTGYHNIIDVAGNSLKTIHPSKSVQSKGYFDMSDIVKRNPPTSTPLYKTADIRKIHGFDESLGVLQDYDFVFRISNEGFRIHYFPDYVYGMRNHNLDQRVSSIISKEKAQEHFRIIDSHLRQAMDRHKGKLPRTLKKMFLQRYAMVLRKLRRSGWDDGVKESFRQLSGAPWIWSNEAVLLMTLALIRR